MRLLCIDPGAKGAFAFKDDQGRVWCEEMPSSPKDISDRIFEFMSQSCYAPATCGCFAYLEKPTGYVPGNSGSAAVKFATNVAYLEMALLAHGVPHETVRPQTWQKRYSLPKDKMDRKRALKALAQARFPYIKCTLINSDALMILDSMTKTS